MISATVNGSERASASRDDGARGICSRMSLSIGFSQLSKLEKFSAILSSLWDLLVSRSNRSSQGVKGPLVWKHGYA